jgi:hypothetical protein
MRPEFAPFQNSFEALGQIALRATGARSFAFTARSDAGTPATVEYAVRVDCAIAFTFLSDGEAVRAKPRLDRIAAAMQAICTTAGANPYEPLVERLADLEAQLMDSKIADRVRGYLADETDADPTEAIARHVETVLRPTRTRLLLEQALSELEEEIEERRLVAQAKSILQARDSVSEEQAHIELRVRSRRSRKPLKDVARQVIENLNATRFS